jgi:paraquat-inducible protein B
MRGKTTTDIHYFKIGSFILLGLVLLVLAIIVFGSGKLLQKTIYVETYFDESVQGLSVGAPVKYRGLQIGYVKKIALASELYLEPESFDQSQYSRYIYVGMVINSRFLTKLSVKELRALLKRDIAEGLRIKLTLQGLTGVVFAELNFMDPKQAPLLPIRWTPATYYIPSATSALAEFSDNVQHLFNDLKKADVHQLMENVNKMVVSIKRVANKTDQLLARTNQHVVHIVNNMANASDNLRILSNRAKVFPSQTLFGRPPPTLDVR